MNPDVQEILFSEEQLKQRAERRRGPDGAKRPEEKK